MTKLKLAFVSLTFIFITVPVQSFATSCTPSGDDGLSCSDGSFLHRDRNGDLHGSNGTFYHRDSTGNYHGNDGTFMHRNGNTFFKNDPPPRPGSNQYGNGNQYGGWENR